MRVFAGVWFVLVVLFRCQVAVQFLAVARSTGDVIPWAFGLSELLAIGTTVYAATRGRLDLSWQGMCLPLLHLVVLLFDLAAPGGPSWAAGLYLMLVPVQLLLRLRMGRCCTVAAPCFVALLERWPYSWIRHPLALCELALAFLVCVRYVSPLNVGVFVLVVAANVLCVLIEERFLKTFEAYRLYQARVPYRYVPGVF